MRTNTPRQKAFVQADGQTWITCQKCGFAKEIDTGQFRDRKRFLTVKCKCGHIQKLELEFRLSFRKSTALKGLLNHTANTSRQGWPIKVVNLSLGGACIEVLDTHDLQIGDRGNIRFTLDDKQESIIIKQVIVRTVSANRIGCQFVADSAYEKKLGFYLRT